MFKKSLMTFAMVTSFAASAESFVVKDASLDFYDCGNSNQVYSIKPGMVLTTVSGVREFENNTNTYTGMPMGATQDLMSDICSGEGSSSNLKLTVENGDGIYMIKKIER